MEEAQIAIEAGADAIGLVGQMPSGPGVIEDETIRYIAKNIPPTVLSFLLTSETTAEGIIQHHQRTQTTTIQVVDHVEANVLKEVKRTLPEIQLVQVIHVYNLNVVDYANSIQDTVDFLLLDSGDPTQKTKILGGTGKSHDWNISKRIVEQSNIPVFLAGGLNKDNVQDAILKVNPYGLDLCSSVRMDGHLAPQKVKAFIEAARLKRV